MSSTPGKPDSGGPRSPGMRSNGGMSPASSNGGTSPFSAHGGGTPLMGRGRGVQGGNDFSVTPKTKPQIAGVSQGKVPRGEMPARQWEQRRRELGNRKTEDTANSEWEKMRRQKALENKVKEWERQLSDKRGQSVSVGDVVALQTDSLVEAGFLEARSLRFTNPDHEADYAVFWWDTVRPWLSLTVTFSAVLLAMLTVMDFISYPEIALHRAVGRWSMVLIMLAYRVWADNLGDRERQFFLALVLVLYFFMVVITNQEHLVKILEPWYGCDYESCQRTYCMSVLPYVLAQLTWVVAFLRLPFLHCGYVVALFSVFYPALSWLVGIRSFQSLIGIGYDMFVLVMALFSLTWTAKRTETLSRYLYLRNFASNTHTPKHSHGIASNDSLVVYFTRHLLMDFEARHLVQGHIHPVNSRFASEDQERLYREKHWMDVYRTVVKTMVVILFALTMLSLSDALVSGYASEVLLVRVAGRAAFIGFGMLAVCSSAEVPTSRRYFLVTCASFIFFQMIILTGIDRVHKMVSLLKPCELDAGQECTCYSLLAFIAVCMMYALVALRAPFLHAVLLYLSILVTYFSSGFGLGVDQFLQSKYLTMEIFSLGLLTLTFPASARRNEILARSAFLQSAEWDEPFQRARRADKELRAKRSNPGQQRYGKDAEENPSQSPSLATTAPSSNRGSSDGDAGVQPAKGDDMYMSV